MGCSAAAALAAFFASFFSLLVFGGVGRVMGLGRSVSVSDSEPLSEENPSINSWRLLTI